MTKKIEIYICFLWAKQTPIKSHHIHTHSICIFLHENGFLRLGFLCVFMNVLSRVCECVPRNCLIEKQSPKLNINYVLNLSPCLCIHTHFCICSRVFLLLLFSKCNYLEWKMLIRLLGSKLHLQTPPPTTSKFIFIYI